MINMKPRQVYNSFEEIEHDLKRFNLERQIALEELKLTKHKVKEDLKPLNWVQTAIDYAGKYGLFLIIKRLLKSK